MQKIVINKCHGGFGLSNEALAKYRKLSGDAGTSYYNIKRDNPHLVKVVEELGDGANDAFADLKVIEVPNDIEWVIEEYDGLEWIAEVHETWGDES